MMSKRVIFLITIFSMKGCMEQPEVIGLQIFSVMRTLWRVVSRNILFWVTFVVLLIYNSLGFLYSASAENYMPGYALTGNSYSVQGGILAFLFLGILFVRIEEKHSLHELYVSMQRGLFYQIAGKLAFAVLFIIVVFTSVYIMYAIIFIQSGLTDFRFYMDAYFYMLLYWGLTFFISLLLGILLATIFKGKIVYPILFLIWPLIGPINKMVFLQIGLDPFLDSSMLAAALNLGEFNPNSPFNALYGFSLEPYHWVKRWIWIAAVSSLILLVLAIKHYVKWLIGSGIMAVSIIPAYLFLNSSPFVMANNGTYYDRSAYETSYYQNHEEYDVFQQHIRLENYDILLDIDQKLQADVTVELLNKGEQPLHQANLTLYRQFRINDIRADGKSLDFRQRGDQVNIQFPKKLLSNEKMTITFRYEGVSSPLFFANRQAIYLPYYFAWLPGTHQAPAMADVRNGIHRITHHNDNQTTYKLRFNSSGELYTNLNQTDEGIWEKETNGVTLISGQIKQARIGDMKVVYPVTWERAAQGVPAFIQSLKQLTENIQQDLGLDGIDLPSEFVYVPVLSISDVYTSEYMWMGHDHLILNELPYLTPSENLLLRKFPPLTTKVISALTWKQKQIKPENFDFVHAFDLVYTHAYHQKHRLESSRGTLGLLQQMMKESPKDSEQYKALRTIDLGIRKHDNPQSIIDFTKEWYQFIDREDFDWNQLNTLAEDYFAMEDPR